MSAYPIMLDGTAISALVVGGGRVAARKVAALVDAGARVHVVSLTIADEIEQLAQTSGGRVRITAEPYVATHLMGCTLAVAATDDAELNASVARDAVERGILVNVVDAPELGNFVTPAVHRAGDIVVAVSAGRLPGAAVHVRDSIARRIDDRYAEAVRELASLRRSLIDGGDRDRWRSAAHVLIGDDFCEQVESGMLPARMAEWR